jgi:hypothetical protein
MGGVVVHHKFKLLKSGYSMVPHPIDPLYTSQLTINPKKVKDVENLARYLGEEARDYIKNLKKGTPQPDAELKSDYGE